MDSAPTRVAIIGSGFGGLGMAIRLGQAGFRDVTIFEKADTLGGTWRDNTYPGSGCDVPSHLYSFSFAPNPRWTRKFPDQAEILDYLQRTADDYGVRDRIRFGREITEARFDEDDAAWTLTLDDGSTHVADVLVAATGQLNRPHIPDIAGRDDFAGPSFHSARWQHDVDLTGKDVAVIGIGASAIQFVPEIAEQAGSLTLYQRSVNYVGPKPDALIKERTRRLLARVTVAQRLYRASIWMRFESRWFLFRKGSRLARAGRARFETELGELADERLPAESLVPDYPLGCRRILISNDWYPTLLRPDVTVVNDHVERIEADAVVAGGTARPADCVIYGTGFQTTDMLAPIRVVGRDGRLLSDEWREGPEAHLGITVSGFPNLFLLYGPNTNLGHNSIIFMLERQIGYALRCIQRLRTDDLAWIDVRPEAQARSNRRLRRELDRTVWGSACHSWYKNASGRITNNWSTFSYRYWLRTRRPEVDDYTVEPRAALRGRTGSAAAGRR